MTPPLEHTCLTSKVWLIALMHVVYIAHSSLGSEKNRKRKLEGLNSEV